MLRALKCGSFIISFKRMKSSREIMQNPVDVFMTVLTRRMAD